MNNPVTMGTAAGGATAPSVNSSPMTFDQVELDFNSQLISLEELLSEFHHLESKTILDNDDPIFSDPTILKYSPESLSLVCSFEGIGDMVRKFLEGTAKTLNVIGTTISKLLMTGFPLFKGVVQKAHEIKQKVQVGEIKTGELGWKGISNLPLGDNVVHPDEILQQIDLLTSITVTVLSKDKLDKVMGLSRNTLEPFRGNIKRNKTDEIVFIFGVMASLTNPAVPVGMVLKQIFSAVSPGAGKALDLATTAGGGVNRGILTAMEATLPTMGSAGTAMLRDLQRGRLNLSALPDYRDMYPFCDKKIRSHNPFTETFVSPVLLGNRQWQVTDYCDVLEGSFKGKIGSVGGKFVSVGKKKIAGRAEALTVNQVNAICDGIIDMFTAAMAYSKSFPQYYRAYNKLYNEVGNIVLGYEGDQLRDTYVRYSYRNAMNLMLGSMWTNSFGSDNRFLRYLLSISKNLLRYCEESIAETNPEQPEMD